MKKIKIFTLALSLVFLGITQSCTDGFEEMNRNPFEPTQASIPTVFNSITSNLMLGWMEQNSIHNGYYYFVNQQLANSAPRYILAQGVDEIWNSYFLMLKNVRWLENELDNSSVKTDNVRACLNILLAYKTLRTADYVGDMPFSKAGKGASGSDNFRVAYDKHQDIYKYCLDLLKTASESFKSDADQLSLGTGDVLFKNDYNMWKKFANSIRLRYAMQIAEVDNAQATAHISNILGDATKYPLITGSETIGMWPKKLSNLIIESRPWSFSAENLTCMGSTIWSWMSENNNTDGSGIFDPRCKVYFETNGANEWKPQLQNGANPVQGRGAYINSSYPNGRDRGQTMQDWSNKGNSCYYSSVNYYLTRDDAYLPEIIMTVAEVAFLKAEAYNRGIGVAKNAALAKSEYENGIRSSINFWYSLVDLCEGTSTWSINKPVLGSSDIDNYLANAKVAYKNSEADALKQIYAQLWLDSFRQPWVAFNLYRRTLATPHDESGSYSAEQNKFYKVPYPESEKNYNNENFTDALGGKTNTPDNKLFWHK
ncbi:MAG TPA: SusD/RagB family nutrient-binding outer membrane lipoprotein [Draconibacterium sp.]|nr:SusD/RagB family nutrient-binding outer membrane lipoprotein [Draconibacterium sp.]